MRSYFTVYDANLLCDFIGIKFSHKLSFNQRVVITIQLGDIFSNQFSNYHCDSHCHYRHVNRHDFAIEQRHDKRIN